MRPIVVDRFVPAPRRPPHRHKRYLACFLLALLAGGCQCLGPQTVRPPHFRSAAIHSHEAVSRNADPSPPETAAQGASRATPPLPDDWEPPISSRAWTHLVLHHSATSSGSVQSIDAVHRTRRDSQGKPWLGIGYHFVIGNGKGMADGQVVPTFRWKKQMQGAHAGDAKLNASAIGICLIGNFNQAPPTQRQIEAAKKLVASLQARYHIDAAHVVAHRDVRATDCPGKLFPWKEIVGTQR